MRWAAASHTAAGQPRCRYQLPKGFSSAELQLPRIASTRKIIYPREYTCETMGKNDFTLVTSTIFRLVFLNSVKWLLSALLGQWVDFFIRVLATTVVNACIGTQTQLVLVRQQSLQTNCKQGHPKSSLTCTT